MDLTLQVSGGRIDGLSHKVGEDRLAEDHRIIGDVELDRALFHTEQHVNPTIRRVRTSNEAQNSLM